MPTKKKSTIKLAKTLTLDQIESKMIELALEEDRIKIFQNAQKIEMLEKVANLKIKRLQIEKDKEAQKEIAMQPIQIEFVDSNTEEQQQRLNDIDNEILKDKGQLPHA